MTTEYHDPDGVFPLLWPQLSAHLPLRNLYFKSSTRPLRSIASLDIDFVPAARRRSSKHVSLDGSTTQSSENDLGVVSSKNDNDIDNRRRHQIPGLRSTPYLKLFLLRCDTKDLYKSTWRPRLRDWIKEHVTLPQSSGAQTDHDAFEWLILHVVLPDTAAAAQPRFKTKKDESGNVKERSSKFPGKRNRPLLEKLRADFNEAGKAGFERVAQIRLARDAVPAGLLRASLPQGVTPITESVQEQAAAWSDLVGKFKSLILSSFHLRVAQYEEDVRERELQRSLPGWNFNTFFILKEGLVQAFEAVGLTEDALLGYDELAVGLDSTIVDQLAETTSNQAGKLAMTTATLHNRLRGAIESRSGSNNVSEIAQPLSRTDTKDYRGMIVSNQISIFDFRCYIFLRQMALLLKLARLTPTLQSSKTTLARLSSESTAHKNQDAVPLADLSMRAAQFTSLMGRTMRQDLAFGLTESEEQYERVDQLTNLIVASWTFQTLQQVLDETVTSAITSPASARDTKLASEPVRRTSFPKRYSSLATTKAEDHIKAMNINEDKLYLRNLDLSKVEVIKNAELANAAACRADLYVRQRRVVAQLGQLRGWRAGSLYHIPLERDNPDTKKPEQLTEEDLILALDDCLPLKVAMTSLDSYQHLYELLSDHAAWFYAIANRTKAAEQLIVDQVLLRFDVGDFAAAAAHFQKLASSHSIQDWDGIEVPILIKYAECLQRLNRKDELTRVRLAILAKSASLARSSVHYGRRRTSTPGEIEKAPAQTRSVEGLHTNPYFEQLVNGSKELSYDVTAPLTTYVDLVSIDKAIELTEEGDGFSLSVELCSFIAGKVTLDNVKIQLLNASTGSDGSEGLWLDMGERIELTNKLKRLRLSSNVNTYGLFTIERIILQAGRILFTHDFGRQPHAADREMSLEGISRNSTFQRQVLVYPRSGALRAYLQEMSPTHIHKQRYLELVVEVGDSEIHEGCVSLRAASAGLRIHTATATAPDNDDMIKNTSNPGELQLHTCAAHSILRIHIPYQAGYTTTRLLVKVQIGYQTEAGKFTFKSSSSIDITVPLDVSVQDTVKQESVWSRFWLRSMIESPLLVLDVTLDGAGKYETQALLKQNPPGLVSRPRPLCVSYKVQHAKDASEIVHEGSSHPPLVLRIEYRDIAHDLIAQLTEKLKHDIAHSSFAKFGRLLLHSFAETITQGIETVDFNHAETTGSMRLPAYHDLSLDSIVRSTHSPQHEELSEWLVTWYNAQSPIQLPAITEASRNSHRLRELLIDVNLPEVAYACTASLVIDSDESTSTLLRGESYSATIRLSYTSKWSPKRHSKGEFIYGLEVPPDTWLVGYSQSARFEANEGEEIVHNIELVPLKTGICTLPTVQMRLATPAEDLVLQTELKSQYQTVTVVNGVKDVTAAVVGEDE